MGCEFFYFMSCSGRSISFPGLFSLPPRRVAMILSRLGTVVLALIFYIFNMCMCKGRKERGGKRKGKRERGNNGWEKPCACFFISLVLFSYFKFLLCAVFCYFLFCFSFLILKKKKVSENDYCFFKLLIRLFFLLFKV